MGDRNRTDVTARSDEIEQGRGGLQRCELGKGVRRGRVQVIRSAWRSWRLSWQLPTKIFTQPRSKLIPSESRVANPYRERWPPMALTRIIAIGGKQTVSTASHVRVTRPPTQKVLPHRALCYDSILNVIRTVLQSGLHYMRMSCKWIKCLAFVSFGCCFMPLVTGNWACDGFAT